MSYKAVLFDLDGTIADTNEIIQRTLAETLQRASGREWPLDEVMGAWGLILREQLHILYPPIDLEVAAEFYRRRYSELHDEMLREFAGVDELLERLIAEGYALGIVTSKKHANAQHTVDDLGMTQQFKCIIAEEDAPRVKPAPDPIIAALKQLKVTADEALYVGDNPDDMIAAHAAGMKAVAVSWSLRTREELLTAGADFFIDSPMELMQVLAAEPDLVLH
ncbi:MAG: HAD family hydrolase [bacterium]